VEQRQRRKSTQRRAEQGTREEDISLLPDYGRRFGENLRPAPNPYVPGDLGPQTLQMDRENRHGEYMDEVRRRRAMPQRLAKGGTVKKAAAPSKKPESRVNEAGVYTKPGMRKSLFNRIKAGDKGGRPGQWSGRKAQMLAKEYAAKGGGYKS